MLQTDHNLWRLNNNTVSVNLNIKEGLKIKNSKYKYLLILNVISGFIILTLLYTNINTPNPIDQTNLQHQQVLPKNTYTDTVEKLFILNGNFEEEALGWNNQSEVKKENSGNHYITNNHSWLINQDLNLLPNTTYKVNAQIKKGTAEGAARIAFTFYDINDEKLPLYYNITYVPESTAWEKIPQYSIRIPENTAITRLYLLTDDDNGFHCFDNISITI